MQRLLARWFPGPVELAAAWANDCGASDRRWVPCLVALPALVAAHRWPALLPLVPASVAFVTLRSPPRRHKHAGVVGAIGVAALAIAVGYDAQQALWGDESERWLFVNTFGLSCVFGGAWAGHAGAITGPRLQVALRTALVAGLCLVAVAVTVAAFRATSALERVWAGSAVVGAVAAVLLALRHRQQLHLLSRPATWRQVGDAVVVPPLVERPGGYRDPARPFEIKGTIDLLNAAVCDVRWRSVAIPLAVLVSSGAPVFSDLVVPPFPATMPSDAVISMDANRPGEFHLEINASGRVTWHGVKDVAALGRRERDLSQSEVASLYASMMSGDFSERMNDGLGCGLGSPPHRVRLRTTWRRSRDWRAPAHCKAAFASLYVDTTVEDRPIDGGECEVEDRIYRIAGAWLGDIRSLSPGDAVTVRLDVDRTPDLCVSSEAVDGVRCGNRGDSEHGGAGGLVPFTLDGLWSTGIIVVDPWSDRALGPRSSLPRQGGSARCQFTAVKRLARARIGSGDQFSQRSKVWAGALSDCTLTPR